MTGTAKTTRKGTAAAKPAAKSAAKTAAATKKPAAKANAAAVPAAKSAALNKAAVQPAPKKTVKTANRPAGPSTAPTPVAPPPVEIVQKRLIVVSEDERYRMIAEAAYYRAENSQFQSDPVSDWVEAEKEIATLLGKD